MEAIVRLGLKSKVARELQNHLHIPDEALSDVVEMVVTEGEESTSLKDFLKKADSYDISYDLAKSLYNLISRLSPALNPKVLKSMQVADQGAENSITKSSDFLRGRENRGDDLKEKVEQFPGLAIKDDPNRKELQLERPTEHEPLSKRAQEKLMEEELGRVPGSSRTRWKSCKAVEPLKENGIYEGNVARIYDYGIFVSFQTGTGRHEGLCYTNDIAPECIVDGQPTLRKGQLIHVMVKVISNKNRIQVTMRDINQNTGELSRSSYRWSTSELSDENEDEDKIGDGEDYGPLTGVPLRDDTVKMAPAVQPESADTRKRKLNDYELWETQQLRSSGVVRRSEMAGDEYDALINIQDVSTAEDVDVEINEKEPAFLRNQTIKSGTRLDPVKILANPEGSLARAAATSGVLARERRELRDQKEKQLLESIPRNMQRPWEDPNPQPGERTIAAALRGLAGGEVTDWKRRNMSLPISYGQKTQKSIKEQRESLPIFHLKDNLMEAVAQNQVLVVIGETGSGKTTQMTQYLCEAGFAKEGIIGCTQPRRVAAMSIAKRVAEEFGCRLGQEVGYSIRFEDVTSNETVIKYMTDGILLRESIVNPMLTRYSVIMLDEAHERTISTDVLFGLLKGILKKRDNLKLIVTSATLDAEKFAEYFFSAKIFTIPGRTFPVEVFYTKEPESDYVEAALVTVLQIHLTEPPGGILVFLTGQEEIDSACQTLHQRMEQLKPQNAPPLIILPVYSSLPSEMQTMIFDPAPPGSRKCVVATNIAEASLTIDGITFVVDPGVAKVKVYSPKTGIESLTVVPISQANARQRSGRAGRTSPGKCYRLYTEEAYKTEMLPTAVPEIQRTNLASTVLQLKAMGVNDLMHFDFMDPPPIQTLVNSLEVLYELGALDQDGFMTRLGRKMAEFPMEPQLGKVLLTAVDLKCTDEIITVIAMLQVENVFYRPRDRQNLADQKKAKFHQSDGDHITYLEVYKRWQQNKFSSQWCFENFVQARSLRRAQEVRKQLIGILDRYRYDIVSSGRDIAKVRKAICAGYFRHAARKDAKEGYKKLVDGQQVYLHPSSSLYQSHPEFLIYHELVLTTKEYLRDCCVIDPQWLVQLAPQLYKKADDKKMSTRKQKERIEPLFNRYEEPNAWRLSRRRI